MTERTVMPTPAPTLFPSSTSSPTDADLNKWPANFFSEGDELHVDSFTFQKLTRREHAELYEDQRREWVDIEYVVAKKGKQVLAKFDAGLIHPLGNSANFGLFSFLGRNSRQVFISEDLPRTGCQWVVSLTPRFQIIFDGHRLGVGREGFDLKAIDLDDDGVYEIIAPITDFYQFQDKLYTGAIPLPDIIFKYDPAKQKYLPANGIFRNRVFEDLASVPDVENDSLNFQHRSVALSNLLIHVYAGEERKGWQEFERDYKLSDKAELKRRVKAILRNQPVYQAIYQH